MVIIYKNHTVVCIVSKKTLQRIINQIEQNGFDDPTRILFNTLDIDLFRVLFDEEKVICPQWYNFGQMDMIENRVAIKILDLFKNAIFSGLVRYSG